MSDFPIRRRKDDEALSLEKSFLRSGGVLSDPFDEALKGGGPSHAAWVCGSDDHTVRQAMLIPRSLGIWSKSAYGAAFPGGADGVCGAAPAVYVFEAGALALLAQEEKGAIVAWGWARDGALVAKSDFATLAETELLAAALARLGVCLSLACQTPGWDARVEGEGSALTLSSFGSFLERMTGPAAALAPMLKARSEAAELGAIEAANGAAARSLRV